MGKWRWPVWSKKFTFVQRVVEFELKLSDWVKINSINYTFVVQSIKVYKPISCHWSLSITPKNIKKSEILWYFQGV